MYLVIMLFHLFECLEITLYFACVHSDSLLMGNKLWMNQIKKSIILLLSSAPLITLGYNTFLNSHLKKGGM